MMRWILMAAALLATVAAVLLTRSYLNNRERQLVAEHATPMTDVLVTGAELEIGQTVSDRNLVWQRWPSSNLHKSYVTRDKEPDAVRRLAGSAARQPLFAGEPVTDAKLVKREGSSIVAVALKDGFRAITIKVNEAQGLAGLVKPGDQVDVILAHKVNLPDGPRREASHISEVVARNARVLGVGQEIRGNDDKNKPAKTITVEVTPEEAEAVALGNEIGTVSLSLRSAFADSEEPSRRRAFTSVETLSAALRGERPAGPVMLVAARALPAGSLLAESDFVWSPADPSADPTSVFVQERARPSGLRGALLLEAVAAGRPVSRHGVVKPTESRFVPLALRAGYRAVSVAIDPATAVGGFISAGDRVDVIYTDALDDQSQAAVLKQRNWSETVATGVRVLSMESSVDPETQLPKAGGTATLEATPAQAEAIALAGAMGKLTLTLRPMGEETLEVAQGGSSRFGGSFTVDRDMSRALETIAGNGVRSSDSILIYRGTSLAVVPVQGAAGQGR